VKQFPISGAIELMTENQRPRHSTSPMTKAKLRLCSFTAALCAVAGAVAAAESRRPTAPPSLNPQTQADRPNAGKVQGQRYNVLFIAVDDLNDWVGCLGGNPTLRTAIPHE
jgi:hypothetical protein